MKNKTDDKAKKASRVEDKGPAIENAEKLLNDIDSDGLSVEIAEAMIAVDPSKTTKEAADALLEKADECKEKRPD